MTTKCDVASGRPNNIWLEGANEDGSSGICLLDTIEDGQVIYVLERDELAREDLLRITTDARLLELAEVVPRLPVDEIDDRLQTELNRHADSIPFYSQFRGQPPFAQ